MISIALSSLLILTLAWLIYECRRAPYVCHRCGRAYKQSGACPYCGWSSDIPPFA